MKASGLRSDRTLLQAPSASSKEPSCVLLSKHLRNPAQRLRLAAQTQKCFAFQVQQVLFADRRRVREVAAGHDPGELAADQRVVIGGAAGAVGEMDAERQT